MNIERRQIWAQPTSSSTTHLSCTQFLLPSNGVISINSSFTVTVTQDAIYQPACTDGSSSDNAIPSAIITTSDPFYASVGPQLYAIGCMTVVSYVLVIILFITPRKFYIGSRGGEGNLLGRHGMISGSYSGNSSVTGVGGRPWLQKVAALSVAISLTLATIDSLSVAQSQYNLGYTDATAMTEEVIDGTEIRIVHCISSTFLWLAQVQTLIRLFPRHKEKVMIKWAGFALIVLDTIFAILDNFVEHGSETHPRLFDDAIPALSYLFELALNLLYAAWVIFYSLSKHRFAFFHPKMRSICLVAIFSLSAVLIPVIFFIMDIAQPDVAGWGEYIRWVGSAAASVIVWEWVERIEALERDERKDGILGREIFDGDEMLEVTPSQEVEWPRQANARGDENGRGTGAAWRGVITSNNRPVRRGHHTFQLGSTGRNRAVNANFDPNNLAPPTTFTPLPPPTAMTPISRDNTTSAGSTVYYVRYRTVASPTPSISAIPSDDPGLSESQNNQDDSHTVVPSNETHITENHEPIPYGPVVTRSSAWRRWLPIAGLFVTRRTSPPQEIATAQKQEADESIRDRRSDSYDDMAEKYAESTEPPSRLQQVLSTLHLRQNRVDARSPKPLSVTVIPPRDIAQQPWSPQPNGADSSNHTRDSRGLPVTVIPSQKQNAPVWSLPANARNALGDDGQLRYDPETAALVGVEASSSTQPVSRMGSSDSQVSVLPDERSAAMEPEATTFNHHTYSQTSRLDHNDTDLEAGQDAPHDRGC